MKLDKRFSKAATEVLEILNYVEDEEFNKIDKAFIKMLEKCRDKNHEFKINENDDFDSLVLIQKTNDLLAYIYRKYWASEEEKIEFDKQIIKNDVEEKRKLIEGYNKLFPYDPIDISEYDVKESNISNKMIKYDGNIFKRIFLWVKNKINKK